MTIYKISGIWRKLLEKSATKEEVEQQMLKGSFFTFSFFFMLLISTIIATLGLLANSAAVIIGAMIIAPLISPIIAVSFGLSSQSGKLVLRSIFTILLGTILTIFVAYSITEIVGLKLAGSEVIARMKPTLLDLGVALAAGAAAAFAFTRPGVSSAVAGIAIAVALAPPLCTVGIALSLGADASAEVGLTTSNLSARGPFLLYLTNFLGIIFAGSLVFFIQYFKRKLTVLLILILTLGSLVIVIPPLGVSMDNLLIRNQVYRNLTDICQTLLPVDNNVRFTNLKVRITDDVIYVRGDLIGNPELFSPDVMDDINRELSIIVGENIYLEFGIIKETTKISAN